MMSGPHHFGLDGASEHYTKHLSHSQSIKESSQLENLNKYFDKCKEKKAHELALEEKELKRTLKKLQKEKLENKRRGSAVGRAENEEEKKKNRTVSVKLQPGKIDFERMSPPSSHDVAVRMLFDKKGQGKKKKIRKKAEHLLGTDGLETSYSHKETSLALPALSDEESMRRSFSHNTNDGPSTEHSARHRHGSKGTKSKKHAKKKAPPIHVPTSSKPNIIISSEDSPCISQENVRVPTSNEVDKNFGPPKVPYRAWTNSFTECINEEMDDDSEMSKLPHLPTKSNLIATKPQPKKNDYTIHAEAVPTRNRRASLDYRDLDFLKGRGSTSNASTAPNFRKAGLGSVHEVPKAMSTHMPSRKASNTKSTKKLDIYMLDHYYALLSDTQKILKEEDSNFCLPSTPSKHLPLCTLKRSQKRKAMALEVLLKQLPGYRHPEIEPKDILNCRYLRLSRNNIESLEDMCRQDGQDASLHPHLTQEQVEDYFSQLDHQQEDESDTDSEIELLCGGTYTDSSHIYH